MSAPAATIPPSIARRCEVAAFSGDDWGTLGRLVERSSDRRALQHVPRISPLLVRQLGHVPASLRHPALLSVLCALAVSPEQWDRVGIALADVPVDRRQAVAHRARAVRDVGGAWDLIESIARTAYSVRPFPEPPALGRDLVPLVDVALMRREAREMRNCLGGRVPDSAMGRAAFYRWRGAEAATVHLARTDAGWRLGAIAGRANRRVSERTAGTIRDVVRDALGPSVLEAPTLDHALLSVCAIGREFGDAQDCDLIAADLWRIHRRAASVEASSYCVCGAGERFVQFRVEYTQPAFRCEVSAHRYVPENSAWFTQANVDLLQGCAFRWPPPRGNFEREVPVHTREHCVLLAEFTCGIHHLLWGDQGAHPIEVTTNVL